MKYSILFVLLACVIVSISYGQPRPLEHQQTTTEDSLRVIRRIQVAIEFSKTNMGTFENTELELKRAIKMAEDTFGLFSFYLIEPLAALVNAYDNEGQPDLAVPHCAQLVLLLLIYYPDDRELISQWHDTFERLKG